MTVTVEWYDSSGHSHGQDCEYIEEGENGVFLYENPGAEQIGYIPYDQLEHVIPAEDSE